MSAFPPTPFQASFEARWVAESLRIPLQATWQELRFRSIVSDSRKAGPGDLFVALPGENFDGHDFIETALKQGASGVLCRADRTPKGFGDRAIFAVTDTLSAYRTLGHAWRKRFDFPVVMIGGSNGKTTTKELLFALLHGRWENVHKTQGSQNGFVGIPMTLLEMNASQGAAVIEVGIDEPGAMIQHVRIVEPTVSVLTIIGPEHLEKLIDLETVAREESIGLTEVAAQGGSVAINCDDENIAPHYRGIRSQKKIGYTLNVDDSDAAKLKGRIGSDLRTIEVTGADWSTPEIFELPLPGRHNAMNLLAAIAVAKLLGLSAEEMRKGLRTFAGAEGRSQVRKLSDGTQVICDYYNSQPASLRAGIELLNQIASVSRSSRWACIADMLELGPLEESFHREPAEWLIRSGVENVALYGQRMKWLADELRKRGFRGTVKHFGSHAEMGTSLAREVTAGSAVLIKGSRGMKMEEVWKSFEQARK